MPIPRPPLPTLLALALGCVASSASALGWGRAPQSAVLGQPLDVTIPLRLDPGDVVPAECVSADVLVGDNRVPSPGFRLSVDTSSSEQVLMRVQTLLPVDEPVVAVTLGVGCPPRMSRRFVLLADPPALAPGPVAPPLVALPAADPPPRAPAPAASAVAPAPRPVAGAASAPAGEPPRPRPTPAREAATPSREAPPARATREPREPRTTAPAPRPPREARDEGRRVAEAPPAQPRLRLDPAEPPPRAARQAPAAAAPPLAPGTAQAAAVEEAMQAVALAASSARAAAEAASAAQRRVGELEATVAQLRRESAESRELAARLQAQLDASDGAGRWTWPLAALAGLLLIAAGVLLMRLREALAQRDRAWRAAARAAQERPATPTSQLPIVSTEIPASALAAAADAGPPPGTAAASEATLPAPAAAPEPPDLSLARTDVLPVGSIAEDPAARDVTIEELLDLEQQAEFFIVLGQDDAAVDLLVEHLRSTGGGSPLPYLKLLEIYRRRGEREAYERTRARFNRRFNAFAPDWEADLGAGRSLEDYGAVVARLQQVWPRPLDAMAELEALMFRKSRGELFELPAYREVLFLYSLARDLLDREGVQTGNVDLLLPLADGSEFGSTAPHPYYGFGADSVFDPGRAPEAPASPVDLDLTQPPSFDDPIVRPLTPKDRRG